MVLARLPTCDRIFSRSAACNLWPDRASPFEGTLSAATGIGLAILNEPQRARKWILLVRSGCFEGCSGNPMSAWREFGTRTSSGKLDEVHTVNQGT